MDIQLEDFLNVYWEIENFNYCWKTIKSDSFRFLGKKWHLQMDPTGIMFQLVSPFAMLRGFTRKLSFLTCDGSEEDFHTSSECLQVSKDKILSERRSAFLPNNTLTARCQFLRKPNKSDKESLKHDVENITIQSKIGVKCKNFKWTVKNFSQRSWNSALCVDNSEEYGGIELNLKSVGGFNIDELLYIEVSRTYGNNFYCVLKVSVLDKDGNAQNHVVDEIVFENEPFWRFPPIITVAKLMADKNLLLHDDTLTIKCDFAVTLGKVSNETVVHIYDKGPNHIPMCYKEESVSMNLNNDLKSLLDNRTLCDVSFQVGTDVIQAHKNILSARSAVFKSMFTIDTAEKINNTVVIEDLDSETMRRLLLYMYTDTVSDIQWENITNLYCAADKYAVLSLKRMCTAILKDNLTFSNVWKALLLADLHQDVDLKSDVLNFLTKYPSEVFANEAWKEFAKQNVSLALQTFGEMNIQK